MKIISEKRCIIGEGPIWNESEKRLYYTNGMGNEICMFDISTGELKVRPFEKGAAAFAFDRENRLIVSSFNCGVFILNDDDTTQGIYDTEKYPIKYCNDMKVGPDGRLYVGTQSGKMAGTSDATDGKLYSIDKSGNVRVLLDNISVSNGLEWSIDEKLFYHTDSVTQIIKEYAFDLESGDIKYTGRSLKVPNVDGFTIDENGNIYAACWGHGYVAVIDTKEFKIKSHMQVPVKAPSSCGFAGENMDILAITTASYQVNIEEDKNAGYTLLKKMQTRGRKPYLFG